jgi:hypothetical protein
VKPVTDRAGTGLVPPHATVVRTEQVVRSALGLIVVLNIANALNLARLQQWEGWLLISNERNPSTWFAGMQLGAAALVAWLLGRLAAGSRAERVNWYVLAAALGFMSLDEVGTVHEHFGALPLPTVGERAWVLVGVLLAAAVAWRLLPFVVGLPPRLRLALIGGGALFLLGAVGVEEVAGRWLVDHGPDRTFYLISTIEEDLELLGVLWVLSRLLDHARAVDARVALSFA